MTKNKILSQESLQTKVTYYLHFEDFRKYCGQKNVIGREIIEFWRHHSGLDMATYI